MSVYPSKMAPFGFKLWQNAFQTIPDISFFDSETNTKSAKFLDRENQFSDVLARFLRSYGETDLKIEFGVKFCFRYTYPEVCTTKNHEKTFIKGSEGPRVYGSAGVRVHGSMGLWV